MDMIFVIWLLIAGVGVGFINGMFGVGGCFLMVPTMFCAKAWACRWIQR